MVAIRMPRLVRALLMALIFAPTLVAGQEEPKLDRFPSDVSSQDLASLQRGAKIFVNYCMGCHSANYMRYNRLQDLGLSDLEIKDNLILTEGKVGDLMKIAMDPREAKQWFGVTPPDLTVIARARGSEAGSGADWLYTYLRSFYRDPSRPTGWNNVVFPNVAMPNVLYQLQGEQVLKTETVMTPEGYPMDEQKLVLEKPGTMTRLQYDRLVADLVNYLNYMAEPVRSERKRIGIYVLIFLGIMFIFAYLLKKEYWKDIH